MYQTLMFERQELNNQILFTQQYLTECEEEYFGSDNPANVWVRQNTSGINEDPSLGVYHEDRWTDWVRVSNVA